MEILAANSLDELRRLIADLRPSHLDDLGLPATLRWYGKEAAQRSGLDIRVEMTRRAAPGAARVRIALFRIAQEALNNTVKHSGAARAWVRLAFGAGRDPAGRRGQRLRVSSLPTKTPGPAAPAAGGARPAWGLLGMRERAELLGGVFHVESRAGHGTHVCVTIPWEAGAPAMTIRLLLVDDHAVVRTGLRALLAHEPDLEIAGEAASAQETLR